VDGDDGPLGWLQRWYESHCDGDWEHSAGVRLTTLDNPGWRLTIDLEGTALEGQALAWVKVETSDTDWLHYRAEANRFEAAGGARNLTAMLRAFRDWAETSAPPPPG
jgi:hypothetical protein